MPDALLEILLREYEYQYAWKEWITTEMCYVMGSNLTGKQEKIFLSKKMAVKFLMKICAQILKYIISRRNMQQHQLHIC